MKKILSLLLMLLTAINLFASDKKEIQELLEHCYIRVREMDIAGLLSLLHPEYTEVDADGEKSTYSSVKEMIPAFSEMRETFRKGLAKDASFSDVMRAIAALEDEKTENDLEKLCRDAEKTPQGRKLFDEAKTALHAMYKIYVDAVDKRFGSLKIKSLKINGSNAELIYTSIGAKSKKQEETTCILIKIDGKWFFKSSTTKYVQ